LSNFCVSLPSLTASNIAPNTIIIQPDMQQLHIQKVHIYLEKKTKISGALLMGNRRKPGTHVMVQITVQALNLV